jgi:hypothetical protein
VGEIVERKRYRSVKADDYLHRMVLVFRIILYVSQEKELVLKKI